MTASASVQVTASTGVKIPASTGIRKLALAGGLPKVYNPMRSTWRKNRAEWRWQHYAMDLIDPSSVSQSTATAPPIHAKSDPVPFLTLSSMNMWVVLHALWPMAVQQLYVFYTGKNPHIGYIMALYTLALQLNNLRIVHIVHHLGLRFGYLDGDKHARDQIPDASVFKVFLSLQLAGSLRPLLPLLFAWKADVTPTIGWDLLAHLTLFPIILDFWFYLYHRACHEVDWLWKFHKTHHFAKHPNSMLTIFADKEQELIEICLIPTLTYFCLKAIGLPMSFYDWWIINGFVMFAEIFGHSGLRVHQLAPGPATLLLRAIDCELVLEDHDLHHRYGWKKAVGYGKQTRLWDRVFWYTG